MIAAENNGKHHDSMIAIENKSVTRDNRVKSFEQVRRII
jgi:hypothetical protein